MAMLVITRGYMNLMDFNGRFSLVKPPLIIKKSSIFLVTISRRRLRDAGRLQAVVYQAGRGSETCPIIGWSEFCWGMVLLWVFPDDHLICFGFSLKFEIPKKSMKSTLWISVTCGANSGSEPRSWESMPWTSHIFMAPDSWDQAVVWFAEMAEMMGFFLAEMLGSNEQMTIPLGSSHVGWFFLRTFERTITSKNPVTFPV